MGQASTKLGEAQRGGRAGSGVPWPRSGLGWRGGKRRSGRRQQASRPPLPSGNLGSPKKPRASWATNHPASVRYIWLSGQASVARSRRHPQRTTCSSGSRGGRGFYASRRRGWTSHASDLQKGPKYAPAFCGWPVHAKQSPCTSCPWIVPASSYSARTFMARAVALSQASCLLFP